MNTTLGNNDSSNVTNGQTGTERLKVAQVASGKAQACTQATWTSRHQTLTPSPPHCTFKRLEPPSSAWYGYLKNSVQAYGLLGPLRFEDYPGTWWRPEAKPYGKKVVCKHSDLKRMWQAGGRRGETQASSQWKHPAKGGHGLRASTSRSELCSWRLPLHNAWHVCLLNDFVSEPTNCNTCSSTSCCFLFRAHTEFPWLPLHGYSSLFLGLFPSYKASRVDEKASAFVFVFVLQKPHEHFVSMPARTGNPTLIISHLPLLLSYQSHWHFLPWHHNSCHWVTFDFAWLGSFVLLVLFFFFFAFL